MLDSKGRIYFSDPIYVGAEERELEYMAVYRVDTDGTVVELTHEVGPGMHGAAIRATLPPDHNDKT